MSVSSVSLKPKSLEKLSDDVLRKVKEYGRDLQGVEAIGGASSGLSGFNMSVMTGRKEQDVEHGVTR